MKDSQKKIIIRVHIALAQGICVLFVGLLITFIFYYLGFRSPYLNRIPFVLDPILFEAELQRIGFYDPLSIQFGKYFINFFTGNWGESFIVAPGMPVIQVIVDIFPNTIEMTLFPLIIGLGGIKLGKYSIRKKRVHQKIFGKIVQVFMAIGIAMPIFFFGTLIQLTFWRTDLPILYRRDPALSAPPFITGFELYDSIISGNWYLALDIIKHSILPMLTLSFMVIPLILKQTRINLERKSKNNSVVSNPFIAGKMFGFLFAFILFLEITFNLTGFGYYFIQSIFLGDTLLIIGCIFMTIIFFAFTIFLSTIIPIPYKFLKKKIFKDKTQPTITEQKKEVKENRKLVLKVELKNYILTTLKNPFTIVGLGLILFLGFISVFPQLITPYTLEEITPPYFTAEIPYAPPSAEHPLGTTKYGYDLLARLLYGTRGALLFGIIVVLIGLAGGSIFGFLAGKFHRYVYNGIIGSMIVFLIFPGLMLLMILGPLFGRESWVNLVIIGILLIPIFTRIIANAIRREKNYINITKAIIKYIPLEMAFAILLSQSLGFIGLWDQTTAQLGVTLNYGRGHFPAYGANIWPGVFIFLIMLGLILLHEGLKAPTTHRDILDEPVLSP